MTDTKKDKRLRTKDERTKHKNERTIAKSDIFIILPRANEC